MKYITKKIKMDKVEIVCLGDWHLGDSNFDERKAKQYIDYVNNNDNVFVICMGDLVNTALKGSVSDVYGNRMTPKEEIDKICSQEYLGSIDKRKFIAFTDGNHEGRLKKETSISSSDIIVDRLGIRDIYAPTIGVVNVQLNHNSYYISLSHGTGGGSTLGGKANRLDKLSSIIAGCDIIMMGHTHQGMHILKSQFVVDKKHEKVVEQKTHLINTGSLLKYEGGYAERMNLMPVTLGLAIIGLTAGGKRIPKKITARWHI